MGRDGRFLISCGVVVGAFLLYLATLAPGVTWGDSAKLATMTSPLTVGVEAGTHPLRNAIGSLFNFLPFGDVAYRQNIMSAFFAALACGVLFRIVAQAGGSLFGAACACVALAVSHIFWHVAVVTESYSLFSFFLLSIVWCVIRWRQRSQRRYLGLGSFLYGLGLMNSVLMFLLIPAFAVYVLWHGHPGRETPRAGSPCHPILDILCAVVMGLVGYSPMIVLFIQGLSGSDFISQARLLLDLRYSEHLFIFQPVAAVKGMVLYPAYLFYQFPLWGFCLGLVGLRRNFKADRSLFWLLLIVLGLVVVFTSTYMIQRRFNIMVCTFDVFAIWVGFGAGAVFDKFKGLGERHRLPVSVVVLLLLLVTPALVYWQAPLMLKRLNVSAFEARTVPFRDNLKFFLTPWKQNEDGAIRYAREVFAKVEKDCIIVADFTILAVLSYLQNIQGVRPDVELVSTESSGVMKLIGESVGSRAVYLADDEPAYGIDELRQFYRIEEAPPLLRVVPLENGRTEERKN